jgi:multidrug efflux pump subunit AcrA (membrane-fusion protein)
MRVRTATVLLIVFILVAAGLAIRAGTGAGRQDDGRVNREEPIVAPSRVVADGEGARVRLDSAEARRIGLATAVLSSAAAVEGRRLTGQVVPEPERTVALRAPVSGRLSAVEGRAWPALGEWLQAGTAVGRVSDAQPLTAPLGGVVTRIGARPGEIVEAGQVLLELADNSRPVVRLVWPVDAGRPRPHLTILPSGEDGRIVATLIGPATEADPLTRQPAYLYRARARWSGAVPGTPVDAMMAEGERAEGALIPDRAVVQWEGLSWAYFQRGAGEYARLRVPTDRPVPGGWLAGPHLRPGDTVVVTGAQELLSEEFRARVTVGDESGE